MQLLHASKFCCCAGLRIGGLIIGWLEVISIIYLIETPRLHVTAGIVIEGLMSVVLLYGIFTEKSAFILPSAVWHTIKLWSSILAIVIFAIISLVSKKAMADFLNEQIVKFDRETMYGAALFGFFAGLFISTVLLWHFTSVLYSLWKKMKVDERPTPKCGV